MRVRNWVFWLLLGGLGGLLGSLPGSSGEPKIEFLEFYLRDQLLIHFDTDANLNYELQYTEALTNGIPAGPWTNLFVAPSIPFPNHYVIVDTRLRPQRFYRLHVFP